VKNSSSQTAYIMDPDLEGIETYLASGYTLNVSVCTWHYDPIQSEFSQPRWFTSFTSPRFQS